MRPLTPAKRLRVVHLLQSGHSGCSISSQTGVSTGTISKINSELNPELPLSRGGRPPVLSGANIAYAKCIIRMGRVDNAVQVARELQNVTGGSVSPQTVRRSLRKAGLRPVVKKKHPARKPQHKRERLAWAESHKEYTLEDWKRVIWSDETKINRLGSDGRKWVWKQVGEGLSDRLVEGTTKFGGGNVMMWGCMCWEGIGYATRIEGRMDAELYEAILEDELQATLEQFGKNPQDIIFQQDNDPKHTSRRAQRWFKDHGFIVMKWPAQSPDLNPIEHLWWYLKRRLDEYEHPPTSLAELWSRCEAEWEKIPAEECQKLVESMPRRVEAVLKAKGGFTKY